MTAQVIDLDHSPCNDVDPEQPSERDEELMRPLRLVLGSLAHLSRLHVQGLYPLGPALAELPPLQVRPLAVHYKPAEMSWGKMLLCCRRPLLTLHYSQACPARLLLSLAQALTLDGQLGAFGLPRSMSAGCTTLTRQVHSMRAPALDIIAPS